MLSFFLRPYEVNRSSLMRVGPKHDGGYVIHKKTLKYTNHILTLGLNDDWSFEENFLKYKKNIKVTAYDHTINFKFWFLRFLKDLIHFLLLKKLRLKKIKDIFKYFSYLIFFSKHKHIKKKIGKFNQDLNLDKIFRNDFKDYSVLLKIDIEGSEYEIINEVKKFAHKLNTLIVEFHDVQNKNNLKRIKSFINSNKNIKLIHLHGNNFAKKDRKGNPTCIEATFVNDRVIKVKKSLTKFSYPLKGLDYPNHKRRKDISLHFER